jgi:hypothetical protein
MIDPLKYICAAYLKQRNCALILIDATRNAKSQEDRAYAMTASIPNLPQGAAPRWIGTLCREPERSRCGAAFTFTPASNDETARRTPKEISRRLIAESKRTE